MLERIQYISHVVADVDAARQVYEGILGITPIQASDDLTIFRLGALKLVLHRHAPGGAPLGQMALGFEVDDIADEYRRLQAEGAPIEHAPFDIGRGVKLMAVSLPGGQVVEILQSARA